MKTMTKIYEVYEYDELTKEAQEKVVNDYINFILEVYTYEDMSLNMQKACDKAISMRTPWFTGSYIWDYCKDDILFSVRQNTYLVAGTIFNVD